MSTDDRRFGSRRDRLDRSNLECGINAAKLLSEAATCCSPCGTVVALKAWSRLAKRSGCASQVACRPKACRQSHRCGLKGTEFHWSSEGATNQPPGAVDDNRIPPTRREPRPPSDAGVGRRPCPSMSEMSKRASRHAVRPASIDLPGARPYRGENPAPCRMLNES